MNGRIQKTISGSTRVYRLVAGMRPTVRPPFPAHTDLHILWEISNRNSQSLSRRHPDWASVSWLGQRFESFRCQRAVFLFVSVWTVCTLQTTVPMAHALTIQMCRSNNQQPWGFRLQGGLDFATPLTVLRVKYSNAMPFSFYCSYLSSIKTGEYGEFGGNRWIESWRRDFESEWYRRDTLTASGSVGYHFSSRQSIPTAYRTVTNSKQQQIRKKIS